MYDGTEQDLLRLLASRAGISPDFHDIAGILHVTSDETTRAILSAMGFRVDSRDALAQELTTWDEAVWRQPCDPILILQQGYDDVRWSLRLLLGTGDEHRLVVSWQLTDEKGTIIHRAEAGPPLVPQAEQVVAGSRAACFQLPLCPDLSLGYYDLSVVARGGKSVIKGSLRVVVAPSHCYVPEGMAQGGRVWGLAVQLYSLRSQANWGVGDFSDLSRLVEWAGKDLGAGIIGLNPLHALKNSRPHHLSPYSPTSRLFLNELYIDLECLPEYHSSPDAQRLRSSPEFQKELERVREADAWILRRS